MTTYIEEGLLSSIRHEKRIQLQQVSSSWIGGSQKVLEDLIQKIEECLVQEMLRTLIKKVVQEKLKNESY